MKTLPGLPAASIDRNLRGRRWGLPSSGARSNHQRSYLQVPEGLSCMRSCPSPIAHGWCLKPTRPSAAFDQQGRRGSDHRVWAACSVACPRWWNHRDHFYRLATWIQAARRILSCRRKIHACRAVGSLRPTRFAGCRTLLVVICERDGAPRAPSLCCERDPVSEHDRNFAWRSAGSQIPCLSMADHWSRHRSPR